MISSVVSPLSISNNLNNNSNTPLKNDALSPLPSTSKLENESALLQQLKKENKQLRDSLKTCEEKAVEEIKVAMDEANQVRRS
jgi:cell shape-determining protein MreC